MSPVTEAAGRSSVRIVLRDVRVESPAAAVAGGATRGTANCVNATIGGHELGDASPTEIGVLVGDKEGVGESILEGTIKGEVWGLVRRS